jgi:hypothetical protein
MITFTKDPYRAATEAATGGRQTVLYDSKGYPSIMQIIPKFNMQDVHSMLGTGIHPAFIVDGVVKEQIFIGVYQAMNADGVAVSIPNMPPANYMDYDQAVQCCAAKGQGWHLMTNWEWAAIALWCIKNETQPRGNTNWRRAHDAAYETGVASDSVAPGTASGDGRTFTGSGPASWRHDGTYQGIADLTGNVWEWTGGLKLNRGRIYMPNDNNYSLPESSWPAQDVYFDASAGPGDGNGSSANGTPILSNTVSTYSENPDTAAELDLDYTYIAGASGWQGIGLSTGYNGLGAEIRQRMARALIAPALLSTDTVKIGAKGAVWIRNYGERLPLRGGSWSTGAGAGLGALSLDIRRPLRGVGGGFRPAFIS